MVIEMPVLDHALIGCALAFTPLMVALTAGEPAMRALARAARLIPRRRLPWQADILLDWIRQDPEPSAAVLQGLFFGRTAPPRDRAAGDADAGARDRPPVRPDPSVLGRGHARLRAA